MTVELIGCGKKEPELSRWLNGSVDFQDDSLGQTWNFKRCKALAILMHVQNSVASVLEQAWRGDANPISNRQSASNIATAL
jgi:hypothetical protein